MCCPEGQDWVSYGCTSPAFARLRIESSGRGVVAAPFPHLDRCLNTEDWRSAVATTSNATVEIRTVDFEARTGDLVWGAFDNAGFVELRLDLTKPACQTFRYDPWSIEPDPSEGNLTVLSDRMGLDARVHLEVGDGGGCWRHTDFYGASADGWAELPLDKTNSHTVCV